MVVNEVRVKQETHEEKMSKMKKSLAAIKNKLRWKKWRKKNQAAGGKGEIENGKRASSVPSGV